MARPDYPEIYLDGQRPLSEKELSLWVQKSALGAEAIPNATELCPTKRVSPHRYYPRCVLSSVTRYGEVASRIEGKPTPGQADMLAFYAADALHNAVIYKSILLQQEAGPQLSLFEPALSHPPALAEDAL